MNVHLIEDAILTNKQLADDYNGIFKEGEDNMTTFIDSFMFLVNPKSSQEEEEENDNFSIEISSSQSAEPNYFNTQDAATPNQPDDHSVNVKILEEKMKIQINSIVTQTFKKR